MTAEEFLLQDPEIEKAVYNGYDIRLSDKEWIAKMESYAQQRAEKNNEKWRYLAEKDAMFQEESEAFTVGTVTDLCEDHREAFKSALKARIEEEIKTLEMMEDTADNYKDQVYYNNQAAKCRWFLTLLDQVEPPKQ